MATRLHRQPAVINYANIYPLNVRRYPTYNAPLVAVVDETSRALCRPVHVVDVGAAVGDTALLLVDRCRSAMDRLDCFEGDETFYDILCHNIEDHPFIRAHRVMLGAERGVIPSLVRSQHEGTAMPGGAESVPGTTLDEAIGDGRPDVVKVDTDGWDGRILAGARALLAAHRPSVIFEWHPCLCRVAGTDDDEAFEVLTSQGYDRFVLFDKYGAFSQFGLGEIDRLRRLALDGTADPDRHYDVAALHSSSPVDEVRLADRAGTR